MWRVTIDRWQMTRNMWHVNFFVVIGVIICTRRECLPYSGFYQPISKSTGGVASWQLTYSRGIISKHLTLEWRPLASQESSIWWCIYNQNADMEYIHYIGQYDWCWGRCQEKRKCWEWFLDPGKQGAFSPSSPFWSDKILSTADICLLKSAISM